MISHWVIWLGVAGFTCAAKSLCDIEDAMPCYDDLINYETLIFPLYGQDESELDQNCGRIDMSLNCIKSYTEICLENSECDEKCNNFITEIRSFQRLTGLFKLVNNLCEKENALRQTYLENAECLENSADLYAACHNVTQESLYYLSTTGGAKTVEAICCFTSWHKDCVTNVTKSNCGENASIMVSTGVKYLFDSVPDNFCSNVSVLCEYPPLPDETTIDYETYEYDPSDNELDRDMSDEIYYDAASATDNRSNTALTICTLIIVLLPLAFSILFKNVL